MRYAIIGAADLEDRAALIRITSERLRGRSLVLHIPGMQVSELYTLASTLHPHEVTLPYFSYDSHRSLLLAQEAISWLLGRSTSEEPPRAILAPQGKSEDDFMWCWRGMVETYARYQSQRPDLLPASPIFGLTNEMVQLIGRSTLDALFKSYAEWMTFSVRILDR